MYLEAVHIRSRFEVIDGGICRSMRLWDKMRLKDMTSDSLIVYSGTGNSGDFLANPEHYFFSPADLGLLTLEEDSATYLPYKLLVNVVLCSY